MKQKAFLALAILGIILISGCTAQQTIQKSASDFLPTKADISPKWEITGTYTDKTINCTGLDSEAMQFITNSRNDKHKQIDIDIYKFDSAGNANTCYEIFVNIEKKEYGDYGRVDTSSVNANCYTGELSSDIAFISCNKNNILFHLTAPTSQNTSTNDMIEISKLIASKIE